MNNEQCCKIFVHSTYSYKMICWTVIVLLVVLLACFKFWLKWVINWNKSYTCLLGKTAIVTGGNRGTGYYTALDFAHRGARVILACRNKTAGEEAREKIIEATGNKEVILKIVDFSSLASVRKFAKDIIASEARLDILVNNAGAIGANCSTTEDGLDYFMQTNHFGPFLLTLLLIGLMRKSAPSRIVNVASIDSRRSTLDINNMNNNKDSMGYPNSKLCNILFSNALAKILKNSGVDVNSLHPGFINTNLTASVEGIVGIILSIVTKLFFRTAEEGAQTIIYVAVSNDIKGVTGQYFDNCEIAWLPAMTKAATDENLVQNVWRKSVEFVKLTTEERELIGNEITI